MPNSSIEFNFKGNLAQLRRDLNEATRLAKQSATDTDRATRAGFEGGFAGLFRRSPERRAELAFHQLAADLARGDIGQAVAGFGQRLSGLGLAAGVGVGVAIGLFQEFRTEIKASHEALANLHTELGKSDLLSPSGITSQIEGFKKLSDSLGDAEKKPLRNIASKFSSFNFSDFFGGRDYTPNADPAAKAQADTAERLAKLSADRANAELQIANIKLEAVTSSEKDAALSKIAFEAAAKRAELNRERANDPNLQKSLAAVGTEEKAATTEVEQKFKLKKDEVDLEAKILQLKTQGLTKEQETTSEVRLRIAALQSQIGGARTEDKGGLQNKITALQQQLPPGAMPDYSGRTLREVLQSPAWRTAHPGLRGGPQAAAIASFRDQQAKASADYYKNQADAMSDYNQWRYGDPSAGQTDFGLDYNTPEPAYNRGESTRRYTDPGTKDFGQAKDFGQFINGLDGIKKGVDELKQTMEKFWA